MRGGLRLTTGMTGLLDERLSFHRSVSVVQGNRKSVKRSECAVLSETMTRSLGSTSTRATRDREVLSVDARGRARDVTGEIVAPETRRELRQALVKKVAAGKASVTERRCLSALQHGGEA